MKALHLNCLATSHRVKFNVLVVIKMVCLVLHEYTAAVFKVKHDESSAAEESIQSERIKLIILP